MGPCRVIDVSHPWIASPVSPLARRSLRAPGEQRIQDLLAALSRATAAFESLQQENDAIKQEMALLRQELGRYRRYVYGRRSERLDDPGQGLLFELGELAEDAHDASPNMPA